MIRRLIFIAALAIAGAASAETFNQTFDRTFDLRPGTKVVVDNTNGAVVVRAWDQPRVRIRATKQVETRDKDVANKALNELRIEVTPSANTLRVHTVYPKSNDGFFEWLSGTQVSASVSYVIDVPRSLELSVETVNGHIEASGVRGNLHLSTTNGRIEAMQCGGALDASTTNGRITAQLVEVTPGKRVNLETTNGRIALSVPKNFAARVDAETSHGSITSEIPISSTSSEHHSLRGTMNGGGNGDVRLRTTNGSIEIRGF